MKKYARSLVISLISFGSVAYFYTGFDYHNNYLTLAIAAVIFALLTLFVKPVLKMLSLPFNLLTFGLFSFFINVIILFGVTYFIHDFQIQAFHFGGATISGFNLPSTDISQLFSALIASLIIGIVSTVLHSLFR
ncbi:MAG TPA: phage holin family protein [Candidatus Saccharimonadales bacterium]|nr:phage holin family protein [Candidatus Saccharimonadales bacterium]